MITVLNTIPAAAGTNVYIDVPIHIEFNQEISDTSLATTVFNLYKQTPKTGGGYTYAAIGVHIQKDLGNRNIVRLTPMVELDKNQEFMLLILGDRNVADGVPQGILSTVGDVMNGNYTFIFTTGAHKAPVPDTEPVVTPGTDFLNPETGEETPTPVPGKLQVIGVDPSDLFNILTLNEVKVEFNEVIQLSTLVPYAVDGFHIDHEGKYVPLRVRSMEVDANILSFKFDGTQCVSGEYEYLPEIVVSGELGGNAPLPPNHKYRISLLRSKIRGKASNNLMDENAEVEITTHLFPKFASAYEVRMESKGLIKSSVSDELVDITIRSATKTILDRMQWSYGPCIQMRPMDQALYGYVKRYVLCKSVYDLVGVSNQASGGAPRQISSKRLGDFSIGYSSSSSAGSDESMTEKLQNCMEDNFDLIMSYLGRTVKAATKSVRTSHYPGRKRTGGLNWPE